MWLPVQMPEVPSPVWGCDFPEEGILHVATGHGFFRVTVAPEPAAQILLSATELRTAFDPLSDTGFTWAGTRYDVFGPNSGIPPFFERPNGERIGGDPETGQLQILDECEEEVIAQIDLGTPRGAWVVAGFSQDGEYLVVADPVGVRVFREEWDLDTDE